MRAAEKSYYINDSWVYYCYYCYMRRAAKHKGDGIIREAFSYLLQAVRFRLTKNFLACLFSGGGRGELISAPVATKPEVLVKEAVAKEFLSSLRRQRRQLWDRSQPDVQQWYQQFLYLGFDEAVSIRLSRVGKALEYAAVSMDAQPRGHLGRSCLASGHRYCHFFFFLK